MACSLHHTRTFWDVIVMPRSRSMSIESRNCSRMSRGSTAPHSSRMRSVRVVLPWSMWLSVLTQRIRVVGGTTGQGTVGPLMANIKSQIKRNRQNEGRRLRNKAARSEIKTRVKRAVQAAETGAEDQAEALHAAVTRIDKAAAQGVIHKNQAANRKSRLMRRLARTSS